MTYGSNPDLDEDGNWIGTGPPDESEPNPMILDENGHFIGTYADFAALVTAEEAEKDTV